MLENGSDGQRSDVPVTGAAAAATAEHAAVRGAALSADERATTNDGVAAAASMVKPLKWDGTGVAAVQDLQQLADEFVAAVYHCGDFPPSNGEGEQLQPSLQPALAQQPAQASSSRPYISDVAAHCRQQA
jgi:hypothetical protein